MAELNPCAFCGATPIIERRDVEPQGDPWYGDKVVRFVLCECGVSLFDRYFHEGFDSNEEAIAAWNRRATDEQRAGVPVGWREFLEDLVDFQRTSPSLRHAAYVERRNLIHERAKAMLAAAPTPPAGDAGQEQMEAALRTIAEWPVTPAGNMDAENMRQVARAAIEASKGK